VYAWALGYALDMHHIYYLAVLLIAPSLVAADVYRWIDEDGNIIYSDKPHPNAEKIKNLDVQTYEAPQLPPIEERPQTIPQATGYERVEITQPANDASIRDNSGNVGVSVELSPGLDVGQGHRLQLFVDGTAFGQAGEQTSFQLSNVDRGTHTLRAAVIGGDGKELATSGATTFHLHRISARNN